MKIKTALVLGFLIALSNCAIAQDKSSVDLPVYPGGEATMEVNLSDKDILPTIKAMVPMLSGKLGSLAQKIDINEVSDILKDVKQIEFLQIDVNKSSVTESDITSYYTKHLPAGDWSKVFWQSSPQMGTISIFSLGDAQSLYGFRVQTVKEDGKPVKQVMIAKIVGKLDFAKLLSMAGKFVQQ